MSSLLYVLWEYICRPLRVDWESILRLAITLAHDAGAELRRRFGREVVVTLKDELNPVTDADQAAETLIRQGIQSAFSHPRHPGRRAG